MKKLLQRLKKLNLPKNKFAVFGSGPLGIRGLREVNDLDLIVTRDLWKKLKHQYQTVFKDGYEKIYLSEKVEAFPDPIINVKLEEIIKEADIFDGVRFVNLQTTIEWKRKRGRQKDFQDIELIRDYLAKGGK